MDLSFSAEERAFRETVRAFFESHLTPRFRRAGDLLTSVYADPDVAREWQGVLHRQGWAAPAWPEAYGGCDWTRVQYMIFAEERARAAAPPLSPMGVGMIGPVLIHYGTDAQKAFFLPKTLSGEIFWCQGYSEPDAGSDLASLRTRADDDGDDFICNGVKTWSTYAHAANWIFCLVRTTAGERPQQGITFLLIDMTSPGIEVHPIISLTGEHIQNAIYFTDVRVPKRNVVGAIGGGWTVAKHLLEFERGGEVGAPMLSKLLSDTIAAARTTSDGAGATLADDRYFAAKLSDVQIAVDAFEMLERKLSCAAARGPADPSMVKVLFTELSQRITEVLLEAAGPQAMPFQPHAASPGGPVPGHRPPNDGFVAGEAWQAIAPLKYLNDRAASIYGGSNEIQRNIMARLLV
jgi:alkylation response protein AidB-like acyl-CoA dehydrogenase